VGRRVSELRVRDPENRTSWRILYRVDEDMVIVIDEDGAQEIVRLSPDASAGPDA